MVDVANLVNLIIIYTSSAVLMLLPLFTGNTHVAIRAILFFSGLALASIPLYCQYYGECYEGKNDNSKRWKPFDLN